MGLFEYFKERPRRRVQVNSAVVMATLPKAAHMKPISERKWEEKNVRFLTFPSDAHIPPLLLLLWLQTLLDLIYLIHLFIMLQRSVKNAEILGCALYNVANVVSNGKNRRNNCFEDLEQSCKMGQMARIAINRCHHCTWEFLQSLTVRGEHQPIRNRHLKTSLESARIWKQETIQESHHALGDRSWESWKNLRQPLGLIIQLWMETHTTSSTIPSPKIKGEGKGGEDENNICNELTCWKLTASIWNDSQ